MRPVAGGHVVGQRPLLRAALQDHVVHPVGVELLPVDEEPPVDQREGPLEGRVGDRRVRHLAQRGRNRRRVGGNKNSRLTTSKRMSTLPMGSPGAGSAIATPTFCTVASFRYTDVPAGNAEKSMITS